MFSSDSNKPVYLETARPLTEQEYTDLFAMFQNKCDYAAEFDITKQVVSENHFNKKPVSMLSVGAGTGHIEMSLVKEAGLSLEYLYALEPNRERTGMLRSNLDKNSIKHDIDTRFFSKNIKIRTQADVHEEKIETNSENTEFSAQPYSSEFGFIFMSHCVYHFVEPCVKIKRACEYLKPGGRL